MRTLVTSSYKYYVIKGKARADKTLSSNKVGEIIPDDWVNLRAYFLSSTYVAGLVKIVCVHIYQKGIPLSNDKGQTFKRYVLTGGVRRLVIDDPFSQATVNHLATKSTKGDATLQR